MSGRPPGVRGGAGPDDAREAFGLAHPPRTGRPLQLGDRVVEVGVPRADVVGECSDVLRGRSGADSLGRDEQGAGEPRVGGYLDERPAEGGDATVSVERAQADEGVRRLAQGGRRWLRRQGKPGAARRAPRRERQGDVGEVARRHLGRDMLGHARERLLVVATHRHAGPETGRTAGTLHRAGARTRHGDKAVHAARDVASRFAREPGVDDEAHAGHRQ